MTRFVDNFWDADFNSTNGYDVLLKRMKDGREMCKDYEEFLKQRAKAEDAFGRHLLKIAKTSGGKEEIGTLKSAWSEVVQQTENCGQAHINISVRLTDEAKKVEDFRETQKEKRRKSEEAVKKMITAKKEQYSKVVHSKRTYENKCREADGLDDNYMKMRLVVPPKEQEKLAAKRDRAKQAATAADTQYQKDVATLEQTRQQWEEQMVQLCVIFEQLEKDRIRFLRNAMWIFANIISLQCCSDDKCSDDMRSLLSECSDEKDIELFICQKRTGNIKPTPIPYECYYKDASVAKAGVGISSGGRSRQTLPPIPGGTLRADQSARALPSPPSITTPIDDGIYSAMSTYSSGVIDDTMSGSMKYMAKFDYEAQGDKELSLRTGDILTIIDKDDETWWYAEMNGKKGHVPADYLGPYTNTGDEPHATYL